MNKSIEMITVFGLLFSIMWVPFVVMHEGKRPMWMKVLPVVQVILFATTFLWLPWVCLGFTTVNRVNRAAVNDMSRPEIVTPPSDQVRESKAEKSK